MVPASQPAIERALRGGEPIPFSGGLIHINEDGQILIHKAIAKKDTDFIWCDFGLWGLIYQRKLESYTALRNAFLSVGVWGSLWVSAWVNTRTLCRRTRETSWYRLIWSRCCDEQSVLPRSSVLLFRRKEKTVSLEVVSIMLPRTYCTPYYGTGLPSPDMNIKKEVCWAIL